MPSPYFTNPFRKLRNGLMNAKDPTWSRLASRPIPSAPSMSGLPSLAGRPNFNQASATKKGFFGKMSPEELKDFKETMAEMDFGVDQEFLTGVSPSPPPPGSFKPMAFDQTAELKKRREQMQSLFPFLTA